MKAIRNVLAALTVMCAALCPAFFSFGSGVFTASDPLGNGNLDASVGLSAVKNYTHAYNIRGADVTINGVIFTGVSNYTGVMDSFGMAGFNKTVTGGSVIGADSGLNTLLSTFNYDGAPQTLTLSNLVAGANYILTFYNKAWGPAGGDRIQILTSASGAAGVFDENMGGEPNAHLLRYTFTATNNTEWVKFTKMAAGSFHFYGFSVEQIFNNSWSSGTAWSSAVWGAPGVPHAPGANADFPAQGSPATIDLDLPVTVGHLQFDGANGWTLAGADALTLQADVGGISVLSTPAGAHTISNDIMLANDLMKAGSGTLTLAGALYGSGIIAIHAGTLALTASHALPSAVSIEIATNAVLQLSSTATQTVTVLRFDGVLQRRGSWGAAGSGAMNISDRLEGTGVLEVLGGPAVGEFTISGDLGGGDLDAAVGLDTGLTYFSAVNTYGGALTVNGVPFDGSAAGNPAGVAFSTANFGSVNNTAQSVVTGQLGALLNNFNYGNGTAPQSFTLRNLVTDRRYTLTFYNRVWGAYANRTQIFTTTSGATISFNEDNGALNTANWLRYTFIASGPTETITITPTNANSFHLYGFSVTTEPAASYTDVTRRDSGGKVIADGVIANARIVEGTGTPGDITVGDVTTTINSLTQSATDDITTVALAGKILALNSIASESGAGALTISNGILRSAAKVLLVDNQSSSPVTINSVIGNGTGASDLNKTGAGTLTLNALNSYSGNTTVYDGTLRITGGTIGGGLLTVAGGTFQHEGGTATSATWETYRNSTVNQTGGTMNHGFYFQLQNTVCNLTGGTSGCSGEALLGFGGGTSATVNISGSHIADWYIARFSSGAATVNLNSGGTLRVNPMNNTGANGVIRFDGGTLAVSTRNPAASLNDWIQSGNSVLIADGGAVIDTAAGSATINRPLLQDGASTGSLTKSGANTLTLTALATYAGETLVQGGTLKVVPTPVSIGLVNASFELPTYAANSWAYLANDGLPGGWVFTKRDPDGNGGIARNGSPWVNTSPEGVQAGFLQRNGDMTQSIVIPVAGRYTVAFKAANRPSKGADALEVKIDGVVKGSWTVAEIDGGAVFKNFAADLGELQAGPHELRFAGTSPDNTDRATAIDAVQIIRVAGSLPGSLPVGTHLTLAFGSALDLNGADQSLGGLSGDGAVMNSSSTNVILTAGSDNQSSAFAGVIDGGIALTKAGAGTLVLAGSNTYSGATLVEGGVLQLPAIGTVQPVANFSFETHDPLPNNNTWGYTPAGATWSFVTAGIAAPGAPWLAASAAIDGSFAGFIQSNGSISGALNITVPGWYAVGFLAGKRPAYSGVDLFVEVDGVTQFSFANTVFSDVGAAFSGAAFLPGGTHTLRFRGSSPVDAATWIDRIAITSLGGSTLPAGSVTTVAEGAVLDLNGNDQTLAGVCGGGVVSNGTLAISGIIAPGGSNTVGTLILALSPVLSGATLLADVALDGSSDLLRVQGNLNLSALTLQVADLELLNTQHDYLIAECTGALTGSFTLSNLEHPWHVLVNAAAGTVKITTYKGTVIIVK